MTPDFLEVCGVRVRVDEVVGMYDVWPMNEFLPFPRFVIKVVRRVGGDFQAVPNVCVRNARTGECEYTCGLGNTADNALADAIQNLFREVQKQSRERPLDVKDFVIGHPGF
jgi:hypothetical protein